MVTDLPDYTKYVTSNPVISLTAPDEVKARPKGGVRETGTLTSTAAYQVVAEYIVTNLKTLQLAKTLFSCEEDTWFKLTWASVDLGVEILVSRGVPFTDWYPWGYELMEGDGVKKIQVQAKYDTTAGVVYAEIVGEVV